MHEKGDEIEAASLLSRAHDLSDYYKSGFAKFSCHLIEAHMFLDQGEEETALSVLRKALAIGRECGYMNIQWWTPSIMSRLCAAALQHAIEVDYVRAVIRKRNLLPPDDEPLSDVWPYPLKLYALGRFKLLIDDKPPQFSKKIQKKPIDMLKALLSLGGRDVLEDQITDLLWPEAEGDAGHSAFTTTLHRLRKLLGIDGAILMKDGKITLNPQCWYVDAWAFEWLIGNADALWKEGKESEAARLDEQAILLYEGRFLRNEREEHHLLSMQERLRSKFIRSLARVGRYYEGKGGWEKAAGYYQKGIEADNLCEEFYQSLMLCYQRLGLKAEAITAYRRCYSAITSLLDNEPSSKTKEIYRRIVE